MNAYDNVEMSKEDGTLIFTQASDINKGVYQCFPKNEYGKAMSNLVTLTRSTISVYPANMPVTHYRNDAGKHMKILCQPLASYPAPTINWVLLQSKTDKNPTAITFDNRVNIDENGK